MADSQLEKEQMPIRNLSSSEISTAEKKKNHLMPNILVFFSESIHKPKNRLGNFRLRNFPKQSWEFKLYFSIFWMVCRLVRSTNGDNLIN